MRPAAVIESFGKEWLMVFCRLDTRRTSGMHTQDQELIHLHLIRHLLRMNGLILFSEEKQIILEIQIKFSSVFPSMVLKKPLK